MKEFIEKLLAKLEDYKTKAYVTGFTNDPYEFGACNGINSSMKIIKQLAEEYNNGWIPCSERLPKKPNNYLVTQYNEKAIDDYCDGYRISTIFFDDIGWWDDIDYDLGWDIIAWQPLPPTYKLKETVKE